MGKGLMLLSPGGSGDPELANSSLRLRIAAHLLPWGWTSIPSETRRGKSAILVGGLRKSRVISHVLYCIFDLENASLHPLPPLLLPLHFKSLFH